MVSETESYRSLGSIIPFRLRTDLEWVERDTIAGPGQWVVFDPVQTEYYYLNEVERKIAMLLDGRKSVQDIMAMVLPSYASTESIPFVSGLVQRMDQAGLLVANHWAKSSFLRNAEGFRLRKQHSVLGFKVPVCDPSPFIRLIGPIAIRLFSWPLLVIVIFFSLGVISNLIPNASVLTRDFHLATNMSFSQVAMIGCILFFIKVLHEIGHALAGYRFGVICREVGLFFFSGDPLSLLRHDGFLAREREMVPNSDCGCWYLRRDDRCHPRRDRLAFQRLSLDQDQFGSDHVGMFDLNCVVQCKPVIALRWILRGR